MGLKDAGAKQAEATMSERALAFLEEWTSDNIDPKDFEHDDDHDHHDYAKELAARFLTDAAAAGIPKSEVDEVVDDLTSFMEEQIEEAIEREEDDADDHDLEDELENELEDEEDDDEDEDDDDDEHKD
jgi:hypothetical protein